jgi:DMSO/TMAO reductase YedYZ molybdopterin-dependent catalytic subunit
VTDTRKYLMVGFAAGGVSLVISFLLRVFAGGLFIPELASQTIFSLMPGSVESQAVGVLGPLAKQLTFAGAIVVNLLLYGELGVLLHKMYNRLAKKGYFVNIAQLSLLSYLALFAIAGIMLQVTQFLSQPLPISLIALYLLPPHIVFGFILYSKFRKEIARPEYTEANPVSENNPDLGKRKFLRVAVAGAVGVAVLISGIGFLSPKSTRSPDEVSQPTESSSNFGNELSDKAVAPLLASEVTPNNRFYTVDVNILTPTINSDTWKLNVKGLVNNPLEFTYEELKSLPAVEDYATLECISNKIGEDLISTALWKGVPLKIILEKAQVRSEATYIVFRCYDGYDVGIPLERAEATILAYEMNTTTLPQAHGFPLRAVVPGLYGMMNAKWITEIELVDSDYEGFWQRQGWANNAQYQIHSTIVRPGRALASRFGSNESSKFMIGEKIPIAGIAFAGDRGISKVEVSVDGGKSWESAKMTEPLSNNTWVLWSTEWNPSAAGKYRITVRATDGTGQIQKSELQNPFPSGATGYHGVNITVEA